MTRKSKPKSRSTARLGAVQALYQMELSGSDLSDILAQYSATGVIDEDGIALQQTDFKHLEDVLRGVLANQKSIDQVIAGALVSGWTMERLDATLRAILRAGVYELLHKPDIPYKVAISEYVDVAHAFFEGDEPGVVNGVLDTIGKSQGGKSQAGKS